MSAANAADWLLRNCRWSDMLLPQDVACPAHVRGSLTFMHLAIVLDCADPERLAEFWAQALGYRAAPLNEPYLVLLPPERDGRPDLVLQRVAEPKAGKNRMHIDLRVQDVETEASRLVELGATRRSGEIVESGFHWVVLADPEGNELCVIGRMAG